VLWRNTLFDHYDGYRFVVTYRKEFDKISTTYTKNYKLNSAPTYKYGSIFDLRRYSSTDELDAVVPVFLTKDTGIPNKIYSDPEENLRVCENISQQYDMSPFIIESNGDTIGFTVWVNMKKFGDKIAFEYVLNDKNMSLKPSFSSYGVLSNNLYKSNDYFCAYHFDKLMDVRHLLIKTMNIDVSGEIIIWGIHENLQYFSDINT
jgi:hypothetical protein